MMCLKPFRKGIMAYGCGQCMPCRINRRRMWTGRMLLELLEHPASCFVTLTYDKEHLPGDLCVSKREAQLFLKRLRREFSTRSIRYLMCGEYGDASWRPHYHGILYGVSPAEENRIRRCWEKGFICVGTAEPKSVNYCLAYVTKNMVKPGDYRLKGRTPEFRLMSSKPGLGHGVVARMRKAYETERGQAAFDAAGWIEKWFRYGGMKYPLGRYLMEQVIEALGLTKEQRRLYNRRMMLGIAQRESGMTVSEAEAVRAARISQQRFRCEHKGGKL